MQLVRPGRLMGPNRAPTGDVSAPTLSSATAGTPTSDGATSFGVTTNEGNGTLYWAVVTNGGSCTDAQLKAGSGGNIVAGKAGSQAVTGTGAQTVTSVTGLTASTTYQFKFLHRDAAGNDSSQASVSLTTSAAASYATLNPSDKASDITLSGGNLTATKAVSTTWNSARATLSKSAGKWYFEVTWSTMSAQRGMVGWMDATAPLVNYVGNTASGWAYYGSTGNKYNNNVNSAYGATYAASNVIGVALDLDNGKIWFAKNNTWQASGDPVAGTNAAYTGVSGTLFPAVSMFDLNDVLAVNFGASAFTYTPPTGFVGVQ